MKLGWRLITEPQSLWSRILKEKYGRGQDILTLEAKPSSCSNAWRGIMEAMPLIKKGVGVAIGDGRQTLFWSHRWLDGMVPEEQTHMPIPEDHVRRRVYDYWQPNSGWDWDQLATFLPSPVLNRVASFRLCSEEIGDQVFWHADSSGSFTIKSALQLIRDSNEAAVANWTWVWKLCAPQCIRMFLWLLLHNRLLINAERFRRHLSTNPYCERCQTAVEDLDHLFRRCPVAEEVWRDLQLRGVQLPAGTDSFQRWVHCNLRVPQDDPDWSMKFMVTL